MRGNVGEKMMVSGMASNIAAKVAIHVSAGTYRICESIAFLRQAMKRAVAFDGLFGAHAA